MSKYTGKFPKVTVKVPREQVIKDMQAWAKMIAADNRYYYKNWSSDKRTHQCPICHPELMNESYSNAHGSWPKGKDGWNCIGLSWAIWHHGGHLPTKCHCGVIANEVGDKLLKVSDAEALKMVQTRCGIKDIKVIRNGGKKIPKSKAQPGDIALLFNGSTYTHSYFIMSSTKIADSTGGTRDKADNIRADRKFDGRYVSGMKILIRYTGDGVTRKYLMLGDKGEEVKKLQAFLNWAVNTKLEEDGKFGGDTEKAVKKFQTKVFGKKEADGKFGSKSLKAAKAFEKTTAKVVTEEKKTEETKTEETKVTVKKETYKGTLPTLKLTKTNAQVIDDTCKWAVWIAGDNSFHYGYTSKDKKINAHHNGCYFCGTNTEKGVRSKKGIVDYQKTYCCNSFVGAAWAHGGCEPKALKLCQHGGSWNFGKGSGYDACDLFKKLGHPAQKKLQKGDVLCKSTHVALYIGNGKIVEAGGGDDNVKNSTSWKKSIRVRTLTAKNYKSFARVYRYKNSVNTSTLIRHGEVSDRVALWQAFLDWYFDGQVGKADRYFGDNTLKWTKKFQEEVIGKGQGDGLVGEKTLKAAMSVKK